jgi:hypothetical protein
MFPYDAQLAAATQTPPRSIPEVLQIIGTIENSCIDGDGLKWFNWLYLRVTQAVENRVIAGGFTDATWLTELDVQFANLYLNSLHMSLTGRGSPGCWDAMFARRNQTMVARIQFALAGMNAHINHDLPEAIVATCKARNTVPQHRTSQYRDYTALNATLSALIDTAKETLKVRLLGDPLPPISHLEDTIAAWSLATAREKAWNSAEVLWHLQGFSPLAAGFVDSLDGLTTVASKALLVPVPLELSKAEYAARLFQTP